MSSGKKDELISGASPHTIKKFEIIEAYTKEWARKLLEFGVRSDMCDGIVYIDCMSNSGLYYDEETGEIIEGSPIRVARALENIMRETSYLGKHTWLYFNDLSEEKIDLLKQHLPPDRENFHIQTSSIDGNDLIKRIGSRFTSGQRFNYLLVYDPYQATIDWEALMPFIRNWGEVILNHMVSDSVRAVSRAKKADTIAKYEQTYLSQIEDLIDFGSDRGAFEEKIKQIIKLIKGESGKE